jgi:hypothetical protein
MTQRATSAKPYNTVGAIDHTKIDETWEASLKHGFSLA